MLYDLDTTVRRAKLPIRVTYSTWTKRFDIYHTRKGWHYDGMESPKWATIQYTKLRNRLLKETDNAR